MSTLELESFPQLDMHRKLRFNLLKMLHGKLTNNTFFYNLANRRYSTAYHEVAIPPLETVAKRVSIDLLNSGIAFAHFNEFFPQEFFDSITLSFQRYLHQFNQINKDKKKSGKSVYLDVIHKSHQFDNIDDPVSIYLSSIEYAAIAAHYFQMIPRYVGSSFWRTNIISSESDRVYSQQWHRDYNDRKLMKVFLYLNDIGLDQGYFEYVAGSHGQGLLGRSFDRTGADGYRVYPNQSDVNKYVANLPVIDLSQSDSKSIKNPAVVKCTAPRGTLIFADTFGLHRGGYVRKDYRDMIMLTYSTNFNIHKPHFSVTKQYANQLNPFMKMVFGIKEVNK